MVPSFVHRTMSGGGCFVGIKGGAEFIKTTTTTTRTEQRVQGRDVVVRVRGKSVNDIMS